MRVVFFGTPNFAVPTLEQLIDHRDISVVGVVTQPDKRRGRGQQFSPSPVKKIAQAHDIPLWQPTKIKRSPEVIQELRSLDADFFVVVAYGQILSQEILDIPRYGCVNNHGSLLPAYRGAAPIQWALYDGERETGMTTMLMDAGMDTGAILLQERLGISLTDNAQTLGEKLAAVGAELMIPTLLQLQSGEITPQAQNEQDATYARLIQKEDYVLDWSRNALALHHQIRGFYPHCYGTWNGVSLKAIASLPLVPECGDQLPPELGAWLGAAKITAGVAGEVVGLVKGRGPVIQTGQGGLLLEQVQLSGKRVQSGWDFVNGVRLALGDLLG
ncbi:methionyl-tRNA formyltransferase [Candidatus Synechococcus calcipolaris G9]|uniref:Methionyl-tRNA formyltransferase n=1 Tax=Candidatus Synechococcus calcipolaris G9 TaxID=1497997 RepID=A0ABT6EWK6_9SYNE|nr:methionyl-tRNA formyltransferase [Candidatus Synechococcus calcipolaris]MDG2990146.1 methionyl-tRNA formyltransferase [Candidatus Synechococcus calcipolaris G9]